MEIWIGSVRKSRSYSDNEVIEGLGQRNPQIEEWFYRTTKRYFDNHFNEVFFDKDKKQEIFQSAFLKLWMEVDNRRIRIVDGQVCRQQTDGTLRMMTCSLTTFLMAFARTEYRELVRSTKEDSYGELFEDSSHADTMVTSFDEDENEIRNRIVDECIQEMSPTCLEILTLFYYQGKSLDQIMEIRKEHSSSKNGLKTAKNKCMNTLRERATERLRKMNI